MKPKFKINKSYNSPENIDYDILGLHKKRTIVKGELSVIEYYSDFDGNSTYTGLQVREERVFTRDSIGLVISRTLTIKWYLEDDTIGCQKETTKYYSPIEAIEEGITRRSTILADAKLYAKNTMGVAYGFDLMNSVKTQYDMFREGYTPPLKDAISVSTKPYLTEEAKIKLIEILTF